MPDDPANAIEAAIRAAFVAYPKEGDADWRGPDWIMPEECAHLTKTIMRELEARGFQIVKSAPDHSSRKRPAG
jgi:hypothetical protein